MLIGLLLFLINLYIFVTQHHAVSLAPQNWKLGECYETLKLSVFGRRIDPKLKKLEKFFSGGEYGELAIKKSE